jgi:hypothetical protein
MAMVTVGRGEEEVVAGVVGLWHEYIRHACI